MNLIKVTGLGGETLYINPQNIVFITQYNEGADCNIHFVDGSTRMVRYREIVAFFNNMITG